MSNKSEVTIALEKSDVWKRDRYGHFQAVNNGQTYRLKIQDLSIRFEKKVLVTGKAEWVNMISDYYRNVRLGEREGKPSMRIGNRALPL